MSVERLSFVGMLLVMGLAGCGDDGPADPQSSPEDPSPNRPSPTTTGGAGASGGAGGSGQSGNTSGGPAGAGASGGEGASAGAGGEKPDERPPFVTDDSGFTELKPNDDTRKIYVSNSGSDSNDGRTPETAVATLEKGVSLLRDGYPDWLLLERGSVWKRGFGNWWRSGRSATERMVIGAYGDEDKERPVIEFGRTGLTTTGAEPQEVMRHLVFVSLHMIGDPDDAVPLCINWLRGADDVLFEDNVFEKCGVVFRDLDGFPIENVTMRRNQFIEAYSKSGDASGIYVSGARAMVLEENLFDLCGWHPKVPEARPTIFNHCIYWQSGGPGDGVVKDNIILRASSHGAQMRSSGHVIGNVFARSGLGGFLAGEYNPVPTGVRGSVIGNLFTEMEDITPREGHEGGEAQLRGTAFELLEGDQQKRKEPLHNVEVTDNILTNCLADGPCNTLPSSFPDSKIENNIVWKYSKRDRQGFIPESKGPFADPDRTLEKYHASIGGSGNFDDFARELRLQAKGKWDPRYTAPAIIKYFREGFAPPK